MSGTFSAPRNHGVSNTKSIKVISEIPSPIKDFDNSKSIKTNPSFLIDNEHFTQGLSREEILKSSGRKDSLNFDGSHDVSFSGLNRV